MSASTSGPSTSTILTITGVTLVGGFLAYATYFDYKRRSDPAFRKRLRKEKKQAELVALKRQEEEEKERLEAAGSAGLPPELIKMLYDQAHRAPLPTGQQERQDFFMSLISQADQLVMMGPEQQLDAAVVYYQALRVYPSPIEMLMLYKQQLPAPVMAIVADMYNLDMLERIHGYYDSFPRKTMNVSVKKNEATNAAGEQFRPYSLIATKSFKAGEEIYVESPIVAALDPDVQQRGTHCTQCLRPVEKGLAIKEASDLLKAVYCSKKCQMQSRTQFHNALFGDDVIVSGDIDAEMSASVETQKRKEAQAAFVQRWTSSNGSNLMMIARLVILQVIAEFAKQLKPAEGLKKDLPEMAIDVDRTIYDHFERLRYLPCDLPEAEYEDFKTLLLQTFPDFAQTYPDERHTVFKGKMAYNAIGVCYGGGRDDMPKATIDSKVEYTRTPYGAQKQIGCGLYFVSSYIAHSCTPSTRPSFSGGTSELHLIATRDIKEGEELTMAYVDVSRRADESVDAARKRRRTDLRKGWRFACSCNRCEEEGKASGSAKEDEFLVAREGAKLEPLPTKL